MIYYCANSLFDLVLGHNNFMQPPNNKLNVNYNLDLLIIASFINFTP